VTAQDTFEQAVEKVWNAIKGQINKVYPVFKIFCEMLQGQTPFEALAEGIDFNNFVKYGIALEVSSAQAQRIEKAKQFVNFVERKSRTQDPTM